MENSFYPRIKKSLALYGCMLMGACLSTVAIHAQLKLGNNPTLINSSALLEIESTSGGFLLPRMSTAQRTAIAAPSAGLQVYDTDTNSVWWYNGTGWLQMANSAGTWNLSGNAGTSTANFIGTTDNTGLFFRTNNTTRLVISSTGNVGIGTSTPNVPLQFANLAGNRKIVLWESGNNTHQFYGFGINSSAMRYQVDQTTSDHVFFAGASASSSNELMRIKGNGNVGIGVNPLAKLHVAGTEGMIIPSGTTTERPATPQQGTIRYNSTTGRFEGYTGSAWVDLN